MSRSIRRLPRWMPMLPSTRLRSTIASVFVLALSAVIVGCGELPEPAAYSPTTSSTVVDAQRAEAQNPVDERPAARVSGAEFVPPPPPGYVARLLVSGDARFFQVDGEVSSPMGQVAEGDIVTAFDDYGGGLVVQIAEGPVVYQQVGGEAETLDDLGGRLLGVGYWAGSPRAFIKVGVDRIDWIQLASVLPGAGRERRTHIQLGAGESVVSFSASRNLQALAVGQEGGCGELRYYDDEGRPLALPVPPPAPCEFPGRPVLGSVALSPDGGSLAYTVVDYRADGQTERTDLVVQDLVDDTSSFTIATVGGGLDVVSSLAFDGRRAAFVRTTADGGNAVILDVASATEITVDLLGSVEVYSVAFARNTVSAA